MSEVNTISCSVCGCWVCDEEIGIDIEMFKTELCDRCWEFKSRINDAGLCKLFKLARVEVVPATRKDKPLGYDWLVINGITVTGMTPDSLVAQKVLEALKQAP